MGAPPPHPPAWLLSLCLLIPWLMRPQKRYLSPYTKQVRVCLAALAMTGEYHAYMHYEAFKSFHIYMGLVFMSCAVMSLITVRVTLPMTLRLTKSTVTVHGGWHVNTGSANLDPPYNTFKILSSLFSRTPVYSAFLCPNNLLWKEYAPTKISPFGCQVLIPCRPTGSLCLLLHRAPAVVSLDSQHLLLIPVGDSVIGNKYHHLHRTFSRHLCNVLLYSVVGVYFIMFQIILTLPKMGLSRFIRRGWGFVTDLKICFFNWNSYTVILGTVCFYGQKFWWRFM